MDWLQALSSAQQAGELFSCGEAPLAGDGRVVALAPHPDDPDAAAVALRQLARGGWDLSWVIVTPGCSGVQDAFAGASPARKAAVREAEQAESARRFGLPTEQLHFLRLAEDADGELVETAHNHARFNAALRELAPALVLLPSGEDSNPTHRAVCAWFKAWAREWPYPLTAWYNEDPKSLAFVPDLQIVFGEETARWKASLLECHRSQSARNQATRGHTFAERILAVNRAGGGLADGRYAERFRVEFFCEGVRF